MNNCLHDMDPYYRDGGSALYLADVFDALERMDAESVDMIFADPPYFLSNDGQTCHSGKFVSVNKGNWDKLGSLEKKHEFNRKWIGLCRRVLKTSGTMKGCLDRLFT